MLCFDWSNVLQDNMQSIRTRKHMQKRQAKGWMFKSIAISHSVKLGDNSFAIAFLHRVRELRSSLVSTVTAMEELLPHTELLVHYVR